MGARLGARERLKARGGAAWAESKSFAEGASGGGREEGREEEGRAGALRVQVALGEPAALNPYLVAWVPV